jgi:hypothetical protein
MLTENRTKELRGVKAKDGIAGPKNCRVHPKTQAAVLRGLSSAVGHAQRDKILLVPDPSASMAESDSGLCVSAFWRIQLDVI